MWKLRKLKISIFAGVLSALGSMGIYFYPDSMVLMEALPAQHDSIEAIDDNEIELLFNLPVDVAKSEVKVTDPNGHQIVKRLELYKGLLVSAKMASPYAPHGYAPGAYRVQWRVTSINGKVAEGQLSFHMSDHWKRHGLEHPNAPKSSHKH
jgi:methionine-rich copper-binding protein CopC